MALFTAIVVNMSQAKANSESTDLLVSLEELSAVVFYHRNKAGLTQYQLAKIAGVGKTVVFDLEKGKKTIQLDTLKKILSALNVQAVLNSPLMSNYRMRKNEKS